MKLIIMILVMLMLTGCHGIVRTVCIEPFSTIGYRTSNPVEVKQDVVDSVRDEIPFTFKKQMEEETWLTVVPDCSKAEFIMSGKVTVVNTSMYASKFKDIFIGLVKNQSTRAYGVGVESVLKDKKTGVVVSTFEGYEKPALLEDTLYYLSRKITVNYLQ